MSAVYTKEDLVQYKTRLQNILTTISNIDAGEIGNSALSGINYTEVSVDGEYAYIHPNSYFKDGIKIQAGEKYEIATEAQILALFGK